MLGYRLSSPTKTSLQSSSATPGSYKTTFYPTLQTTLSYRIYGTIEEIPVDFTFTCNPAGHARVPDDSNEVKISDKVSRLSKRGAFGCPITKSDVGFPEPAPSVFELQGKLNNIESAISTAQGHAGTARLLGIIGLVMGLLGMAVGVAAIKNGQKVPKPRRKK